MDPKKILVVASVFLMMLFSSFFSSCALTTITTHASGPCLQLNATIADKQESKEQALSKKAGETITTNWQVQQSNISGPNVQFIQLQKATLQEKLFGPFASLDAIKQISTQGYNASHGQSIASSHAITITQCTPMTYQNILTIPSNLQPGYYDLYQYGVYTLVDGTPGGFSSDNSISITK